MRVLADPELLQVVVQPLVNLKTGAVAGWEVLTRTPDELDLSPSELFAAAAGMGVGADLHVIAVRAALTLRDSLPDGAFLTMNVDPHAVVSGHVQSLLRGQLDLSGLIIELVESAWPTDPTALLSTLGDLRALGARIAVDDVGAGYSGLSQLMAVRPELIKLDKSLIQNLPNDPAAKALVTAVSLLSGSLDAWIAVEGIEDSDQLQAVFDLGIPLAQGYLFGRPAQAWPQVDTSLVKGLLHADVVRARDVADLMRPPALEELITDDRGRPARVRMPTGAGDHTQHPVMAVAPSTTVTQALTRAVQREPGHRFAPLVVTSPLGLPLGLVDIEDMVLDRLQPSGSCPEADAVRAVSSA